LSSIRLQYLQSYNLSAYSTVQESRYIESEMKLNLLRSKILFIKESHP